MKYDLTDNSLPNNKKKVSYAIEEANSLAACAHTRRLRSKYLRSHPLDWAVLSAGDMLDKVERSLSNDLQPKLTNTESRQAVLSEG